MEWREAIGMMATEEGTNIYQFQRQEVEDLELRLDSGNSEEKQAYQKRCFGSDQGAEESIYEGEPLV